MAKMKMKTGLSYPYIEYSDLAGMSYDELKKLSSHLRKMTWQRVSRLKQKGYHSLSPAVSSLSKKMKLGAISSFEKKPAKKGKAKKDTSRLIGEIMVYSGFLSSKTSTIKGYREYEKKTKNRLGDAYEEASTDIKRKFWEIYETRRKDIVVGESDRIQKQLVKMFIEKGHKYATEARRKEFDNIINSTWEFVNAGINPDKYDEYMDLSREYLALKDKIEKKGISEPKDFDELSEIKKKLLKYGFDESDLNKSEIFELLGSV